MTDNPFLAFADGNIANPVKSRLTAAESRRARSAQAEKEMDEDTKLLKLYKREQKRRLQALLDGPFGKDMHGLLQFMRTMTLSSAPALVKLVKNAVWIKALPEDHKYIVLRLVSHHIARVREKNGLPPFDDGTWGQQPKAFEQIKHIITERRRD